MELTKAENQNALLELILDLKVEALAYQKQADDDHDFALKMMEERDSFERSLSMLERENEELNIRLETALEQIEDFKDSVRKIQADLVDTQADRDIAKNECEELKEEVCKLRVELEGVE